MDNADIIARRFKAEHADNESWIESQRELHAAAEPLESQHGRLQTKPKQLAWGKHLCAFTKTARTMPEWGLMVNQIIKDGERPTASTLDVATAELFRLAAGKEPKEIARFLFNLPDEDREKVRIATWRAVVRIMNSGPEHWMHAKEADQQARQKAATKPTAVNAAAPANIHQELPGKDYDGPRSSAVWRKQFGGKTAISPSTLSRWRHSGKIRSMGSGRRIWIHHDDVKALTPAE